MPSENARARLARRIRHWLDGQGLKQEQAASLFGHRQSWVSKQLRQGRIELEQLDHVAKVMRVDPGELVTVQQTPLDLPVQAERQALDIAQQGTVQDARPALTSSDTAGRDTPAAPGEDRRRVLYPDTRAHALLVAAVLDMTEEQARAVRRPLLDFIDHFLGGGGRESEAPSGTR